MLFITSLLSWFPSCRGYRLNPHETIQTAATFRNQQQIDIKTLAFQSCSKIIPTRKGNEKVRASFFSKSETLFEKA